MQTEDIVKFEKVVQKIDPQSRLLNARQLLGGVSARVTALEIVSATGQITTLVVRQHGEHDLSFNPDIPKNEFQLLKLLESHDLAIPKAYYFDDSGEIFDTPYLVIEYIEGTTEVALAELNNYLFEFASTLVKLHQIELAKHDLSFLPKYEDNANRLLATRPVHLDDSLDEGLIRDTLEQVWPLPQINKNVLLHGDFWPGNILWRKGQLVAVLDWEDAAVGDPLADLAVSRLEVLWAFGFEGMQTFTRQYQSLTKLDYTHLPYWDLYAALRPASRIAVWAGSETREKTMREGHRLFLKQALESLGITI